MFDGQFLELSDPRECFTRIWLRFEACCSSKKLTEDNIESINLLRAINSFRWFPEKQDLFEEYPEFKTQEKYVDLLWNHFKSLNSTQLSDLYITTLDEVI
jgi:hypothetical protein